MGRLDLKNPWVAAFFAWLVASALVAGVFAAWQYAHGQPIKWEVIRDASLIVAPLALFRAWRDRGRKE